ncbi:MAG: ATP phosphoribosyltransferase regulatory subunit [Alphaproteobacteria bacterium]|nr:ATP phosphoribosyltransferase regulatory subunit [Alphaproteobacteria bacterium]
MNSSPLLPSGLMDVLPPQAMQEFGLIHHLLKSFTGFGYEPVIPPVMEFEEQLLSGQGEATGHHAFRVMDPLANKMLAFRADMTSQITRIASNNLSRSPRPLRLCYAGYTLRTTPEALQTRRQHTQVGIERYGSKSPAAQAEIISIAVHSLKTAGLGDMTVDIHFPSLLSPLLKGVKERDAVIEAVKHKDTAKLRALGATDIAAVIDAVGSAMPALEILKTIKNADVVKAVEEVTALTNELQVRHVPAHITVDLLELSGYGYYAGAGFALFLNNPALELGRGGAYLTPSNEEAVGFTLYANDLLEILPASATKPVKKLPANTSAEEAAKIQSQGFVTLLGE